jgi:lysophospholipase L1-like esterase
MTGGGHRGRRSLPFRVVASIVVIVVIATMLEQGARFVGAEFPEWRLADAAGVVMSGHPTRLWALSPGPKRNAGVIATINALGMRGPAPEDPKPAGRLRVLVLGDSTYFGHGVADEDTFPAQLQARLRAGSPDAPGLDVEVLNGGVPGYSTEQTRIQLDEVGWALAPDLLVVGNLWSDNNVDSFRDEDLLATARARANNPLYTSHFFRLLVSAVDEARGGDGARLVTWTRQTQWPETGSRRVSLRRYAENLDFFAREAATRGIGVAILAPCNIGIIDGRYGDGASWDVFFDAQRQVAAHHGIPLIETLPALRAAAGGAPDALFLDVMHPSTAGHAVFAQAADEALRAAGWPTERLLATGGEFPAETLVDNRFNTGDPNPSSPQRNLFGDGSTPPPPNGHERPASKGQPAMSPAAPAPSRERTPTAQAQTAAPEPVPNGPRWALSGSVRGGEAPYQVEVRAPGGAVVASVRLAAAGPFDVRVRGDVDAVEIVATDTRGATDTRAGRRGGPAVELMVP